MTKRNNHAQDSKALRILVCDADKASIQNLVRAIKRVGDDSDVQSTTTLFNALKHVENTPTNVVFVDLFSLGLDDAASFVFRVRERFRHIVFVLYIDVALSERRRAAFYRGDRRRFAHYIKLDKRTPVQAFDSEVGSVLNQCRRYLARNVLQAAVVLQQPAPSKSNVAPEQAQEALDALTTRGKRNTVFLSHRFAETEYVEGLHRLLEERGFTVVKGDSANTYVSRAVLDRIRESEYFLSLMTKDAEKSDGKYLTSAWLLEEKGAALAFEKPLVMMVEDGVTNFGGLQGDWQRIHFTAKGFLKAALQAADQLQSYSGKSPSRQDPSKGRSGIAS